MNKIILIISLFLLCFVQYALCSVSVNVLDSTDDFTIVEVLVKGYSTETIRIDGSEYLHLNLNTPLILEAGKPELPIITRSLMIPPTSKMKVEILEATYSEFSGHIVPSKGSFSRTINPDDVPFTFSDVYSTDAYFPESLVSLGEPYIMREIRGIAFVVSPFSYNPVAGVVRAYERITFKVYADGYDSKNAMQTRSSAITTDFVPVYKSHFLNYGTPPLPSPAWTGGAAGGGTRYTPLEEQGSILVISHSSFMETIDPYVQWKRQKGIQTDIIDVAIAGATQSAIKSFISNYWEENPSLAYILLVGDVQQIPSLTVTVSGLGAGGGSDPDYVMLAGDDWYPDLFIGRFSGTTVAEIQTQVERTIYYERDIDESATWLTKAIGLASTDGPSGSSHNNENDIAHMNLIRNLLLTYHYDSVDQIHQGTGTSLQLTTRITDAVNEGRGLINYIGHGYATSWTNPPYNNSNVNALTNDWMLPFVISVACLNGKFESLTTTCFAETWLRATNNTTGAPTGAMAMYASSINQPWHQPMWAQDHMMELLVAEAKTTTGGLFFSGSAFMLDTIALPGWTTTQISQGIGTMRTWNIFGDPSLMVRTNVPSPIAVEADTILFYGVTEYPVSTSVAGALVSLYRPDTQELIATAYADSFGLAMLEFEGFDEQCELLLTVTAFNHTTYIHTISVLIDEGAFLRYTSYNFAGGQLPAYGSTVGLNINVANVGVDMAENVIVTLSSDDEYITLLVDTAEVEMIDADEIYEIAGVFSFHIAETVPDKHKASFTITMTDDSESRWNSRFSVTLYAPDLSVLPLIIDDTGTTVDLNSRLDPGETVELRLPFRNEGGAPSRRGTAMLFSTHPLIYIHDHQTIVEEIPSAGIGYAIFVVSADTAMALGEIASFGYGVDFTTQSFQSSFAISVGEVIEGFESGDFTKYDWINTSDSPWTITNEGAFEGFYSAVSGEITHGQSSILAIERSFEVPGRISFWLKVSSEPIYDKLAFMLNSETIGVWSGEVEWTYVDFAIPAGEHLLRWAYLKENNSVSAGEDKAWIDLIVFPSSGASAPLRPILYTDLPESFDFSDAEIGDTYQIVWTMTNFGNLPLQGTIYLTNGLTIPSMIDNFLNYYIPLNSSETFTVTFSPETDIDYSGTITITTNDPQTPQLVVNIDADLSVSNEDITALPTTLYGNYPNPFNPSTTIEFGIRNSEFGMNSPVQIDIYNIKGQKIRSLVNNLYPSGKHKVVWNGTDDNGRNVSSGIYFYRMKTDNYTATKKMILMK